MLGALLMLGLGLRLSAFFSGSETGFYRLSIPRLSIDAGAGDERAASLLWFSKHPAYFVATCLIGNNVANYLTTAAISSAIVILFGQSTDALEVGATLLLSPIIFQFAELLPKSVYYHAPLSRLRKGTRLFSFFFRAFFLMSCPLVFVTRLFERLSGQQNQPSEIVLGRSRLTQLLQHGHEEGVLTDLQSRLANGLLQIAPQSAVTSMIPANRVLGLPETASRQEIIDYAEKYGTAVVCIHLKDSPQQWYGFVIASELITSSVEQPTIHSLPVIAHDAGKLQALHQLQTLDASYGVVMKEGTVLGVIKRHGLVAQLFRPESTTVGAAV